MSSASFPLLRDGRKTICSVVSPLCILRFG